jgi:hypothetical protein
MVRMVRKGIGQKPHTGTSLAVWLGGVLEKAQLQVEEAHIPVGKDVSLVFLTVDRRGIGCTEHSYADVVDFQDEDVEEPKFGAGAYEDYACVRVSVFFIIELGGVLLFV